MIGRLAVAAVLGITAIMAARTALLPGAAARPIATPGAALDPARLDEAADRFLQGLQFQTISSDPAADENFGAFNVHLRDSFPDVVAATEVTSVGRWGLLWHWRGQDPSCPALVLLAHTDVVPADPRGWTHPPFAGVEAEGALWGRGAMDFKLGVFGALEAASWLLGEGFSPRCSVYLAFGHDEEVGGQDGAARIAARLAEERVAVSMVVDEGMVVTEGIIPGIERRVALVGLAEKGYLTLDLSVAADGGHSSMPPTQTAAGILAAAVARLQGAPFPFTLEGLPGRMFSALAPHMGLGNRLVFANLWAFSPLVRRKLRAQDSTRALLHTTTAVTMLASGSKDNVLPRAARATVNFRIRPGETRAQVIARTGSVLDDPRVTVTPRWETSQEPSPVSRQDLPAYATLTAAIGDVFPDAIVAPALVLGATDARHFTGLTEAVYRFSPQVFGLGDQDRVHGPNERVPRAAYGDAIRWYRALISRFGEAPE